MPTSTATPFETMTFAGLRDALEDAKRREDQTLGAMAECRAREESAVRAKDRDALDRIWTRQKELVARRDQLLAEQREIAAEAHRRLDAKLAAWSAEQQQTVRGWATEQDALLDRALALVSHLDAALQQISLAAGRWNADERRLDEALDRLREAAQGFPITLPRADWTRPVPDLAPVLQKLDQATAPARQYVKLRQAGLV